jgi:hypothetical protein
MMTIEDNIVKHRPNITQSSLETYLISLKNIRKLVDNKDTLNNTKFLHDYDKIIKLLDKYKITTRKNKLTSIIVALSSDKKPNNELITKYQSKLKELNDEYMIFLNKQEKTDKQRDNWLEYNELIEVCNEITNEIKKEKLFTKKTEHTNKEINLIQQLVILRVYFDYPLRNDYANMKIINNEEYEDLKEDDENNYLLIDKKNMYFVLNDFKNKKRMGKKKIEINKNLENIIKKWLKINKSGYFLVKTDMKTPMSPNDITKYLNKLFMKRTGKLISSSLIRHIVISKMSENEPTSLEQQEKDQKIENKFLHSSEVNKLYRKVK